MKRHEFDVSLAFCMVLGTLQAASTAYAGPPNCGTTSTGLELCVRFDNLEYAPALDQDFTRDLTTDPDNPSVEFLLGDDGEGTTYEWRVWCETAARAPANIGSVSGSGAEDYDVKILDDDEWPGPGAANVGQINLNPSNPSNFSRISQGWINGNLTGDLLLQEDDGTPATGGELDLWIQGNAAASITAPIVKFLLIEGNLSGNVTVSNKLDGTLEVRGTVDDVVIHIEDTGSDANLLFNTGGESGESVFDADLTLTNGIHGHVVIHGTLPAGRTIDLNDGGVQGQLYLAGGDGDIVNGGDVKAGSLVRIAHFGGDHEIPAYFSGTATFANVDAEIGALGAYVDGLIHVTGYLNETIAITCGYCDNEDTGHLLPDGRIWVEGDMLFAYAIYVERDVRGKIQVDGDIVGELGIMIWGDLTGDIDVGGEITSTGRVAIDGTLESTGRILVDGLCSGDVTIGEGTEASSLIHLSEGLAGTGHITINASEGLYDANGSITVGEPGFLCPSPGPQGPFAGTITIKNESEQIGGGDLAGLINIGCLAGAVSGDIVVEQDMTSTGAIRIGKPATATIEVKGALDGSARIFVEGLYGGDLTIGTYTGGLSLIHLEGGLDSGGCVKINAGEGDYDANGTIHVGVDKPYPIPLGDVTYYGSIEIEKEAEPGTGGGDLNGTIRVLGCHEADADPLDICIRGDENGTVSLIQTGCDPIVGRDCVGGCP